MSKATCDNCQRFIAHNADKCQRCGAPVKNMVDRFRENEGQTLDEMRNALVDEEMRLSSTPKIKRNS